jgi:hypothetical protein
MAAVTPQPNGESQSPTILSTRNLPLPPASGDDTSYEEVENGSANGAPNPSDPSGTSRCVAVQMDSNVKTKSYEDLDKGLLAVAIKEIPLRVYTQIDRKHHQADARPETELWTSCKELDRTTADTLTAGRSSQADELDDGQYDRLKSECDQLLLLKNYLPLISNYVDPALPKTLACKQ